MSQHSPNLKDEVTKEVAKEVGDMIGVGEQNEASELVTVLTMVYSNSRSGATPFFRHN